MMTSRTTPKVDTTDYLPGNPNLIIADEASRSVFNTWKGTGVAAAPGDHPAISSHLDYMFPILDEREQFTNRLAYHLQHPAAKAGPAILLIGPQGTGKSFWRLLITKIVGARNVIKVESEHLNSRFTAQLGNRQVLFVEELMHKGRLEMADQLKEWITGDTMRVEAKGIEFFTVRTPRLLVFMSNHEVPIYMSEDDRRWEVYACPGTPKDADYYHTLFKEGLEREASAFKYTLLSRDLTHFIPQIAKHSEAKRQIIFDSLPPLERELRRRIEEREPPFHKDLVTQQEVASCVGAYSGERFRGGTAIANALRACGCVPLPQVRLSAHHRVRLWAVRDHLRWQAAEDSELRSEYSSIVIP